MPDTKILEAAQAARKEFEKAKDTFSRKGESLERRANSTSIHISYDGTFEREKARSLIKEGLELSRDLYVTCETIVGTLDRVCRPLLVLGPSAQAVGAVASLIDEIVKELDDTRVTFNASLNGSHTGSAESDAFKPSIEARIIQGFWNNEYRSMPDYALEEKRRKDEKLLIKKKEKEAMGDAEQVKKALDKEIENMRAQDLAVSKRRDDLEAECERAAEAFEAEAEKALEAFLPQLPAIAAEETKALEERRRALIAEMKRPENKAKNEYNKYKLEDIEYEKAVVASAGYTEAQTVLCRLKIKEAAEAYRAQLDSYLEKRFREQKKTYKLSVPKRAEGSIFPNLSGEESSIWNYVSFDGCCDAADVGNYLGEGNRVTALRAASTLARYGLIYRIHFAGTGYYVAPGATATFEKDVYVENGAYAGKPVPKAVAISFTAKDCDAKAYKKDQVEKLKREAAAKKSMRKKAGIAIGIAAAIVALCIAVPLTVSNMRFSTADGLFAEGKYDEAKEIYTSLGSFGDSEKRIETIKAIEEIIDLKPEKAVKTLLAAGVPVEVAYDAQGGILPGGRVLSSVPAVVSSGESVVTYNKASEFEGFHTPERTGYRFYGWVPVGYSYALGGVFKLEVSATWDAGKYNVTFDNASKDINVIFDHNYSGAKADTVALKDGQALKYPAVPQRKGYVFTGWYKDADCTERYGFNGVLESGMRLYAGWVTMSEPNAYDNEQIYPSEHATEDDYHFVSLKNSAEDKIIYRYLVAEEAGEHKIYFKSSGYSYWIRIYNLTAETEIMGYNDIFSKSYDSVSFECEAGDVIAISMYKEDYNTNAYFYFEGFGAPESSATASINGFIADENLSYKVPVTFDSQFDLPAITRKGYSFLGWYNGETKMESGIWNIASDVVLTPRWQAGGNTVWLDAAGGTVSVGSLAVTFDAAYVIPTPVRENYTFAGWYCGEEKYESGVWSGTDDVTLTAKWVPVSYGITYELAGGVNSPLNPEEFTAETPNITLADPERTGYKFLGWYTDSSYSEKITEISTEKLENVSVYAKWEIITYTVTYETNGGTLSGAPTVSFTVNDLPLSLPVPSKDGLAFINWNKNTFDGEVIEEITEAENITLVASYMDPNLKLTLSYTKKYYYVAGYLGTAAHVDIPAYYMGLPVQEITSGAFKNNSSLVSVAIPSTVTKIGSEAFDYCESLESVVIPDSVTSIGDWAFYRCESLKSITLSNGLKTIGDVCFAHCTSLESVDLPDSLISLGGQSFSGCTSLKSVKLSAKMTSIEYNTFEGCSSLESIELHEGIISIEREAFEGCSKLAKIIIPASVTSIGNKSSAEGAFDGCSSLSIYCRAATVPSGWVLGWNGGRPVTWGYIGN